MEDVFTGRYRSLKSPCDGIIIGVQRYPMVYSGDAVLHIAET
ncbi:MAG: hypothetical protein AAGI01_09105 [Myxococcota bacterium]